MYLNGCTMESVNQILYDLADENERKDYELSFVSCCTDEMLKKLESNAALKGKKVFQTEITTQSWDQMLPQRFLLLVIDKEVYLCSHDEICLPEDCSYLFSGGFIGDDCDYDLAEFKKINLEGVDASEVKSMTGMFEGCRAYKLDLSNFDTSRVTRMRRMFFKCKAPQVDIRGFDTSCLRDARNMFYQCSAEKILMSEEGQTELKELLGLNKITYK